MTYRSRNWKGNIMIKSGVSPTTDAYPIPAQDGFNQVFQDFKSIGSAIQSGDLAGA